MKAAVHHEIRWNVKNHPSYDELRTYGAIAA